MCIRDSISGDTVSKFVPEATTPATTLTGLSTPAALAFDNSGNLLVVNEYLNPLSRFAPVSYTHLDVYKRQFQPSATACASS